jgi:ATP-dependent Clp protease ATP-binding subunit ClpB
MNNIQDKLNLIEEELTLLYAKKSDLTSKWQAEKNIISKINELKNNIENTKIEAEQFERQGDLSKVAEIRYSKLHNLQKQLKENTDKLAEIHKDGAMLTEEVTDEDIASVVSKWTSIPISKMMESERKKILQIDNKLHNRVIGQENAVNLVSNAIRRSRAGLQDQNKPIGSFLFIGPTGVGKTELAKSLADFLFDNEDYVVRIDMSEYMEKHSVSKLVGAPPGYIGYEQGGQLTESIRRHPYSVILLDEIEKAHTDVFNILLQILDDGRLTDSKGRLVNFKNTIIILTSNLGTEIIQNRFLSVPESEYDTIYNVALDETLDILKTRFKPEFINRIDEIVLFKPLLRSEIDKITELQLEKVQNLLLKNKIELTITQSAKRKISELGYDINYGARPLKRVIQRKISDSLAVLILDNNIQSGDHIIVDWSEENEFEFKKNINLLKINLQ